MKKALLFLLLLLLMSILLFAQPVGVGPPVLWNDELWKLYDNGDTTKRMEFELSGITTGNTRTITIADEEGDTGNWNDAYDYSIIGHLPLTGGTLTGTLIAPHLTLNSATSVINYGDAGALDYLDIIGQGTAANFVTFKNAAASNQMGLNLTALAATWLTTNDLFFQSTTEGIKLTVATAGKHIELESPTIIIDGASTLGDGGITNYLAVSDTGVVTMAGTAKRDLTLRADLDYTLVTAQGKPTQIIIGIMHGYSLPLYAADEELYFNENVPGRWDGASDIKFHVLVALALAETADETFKFQWSWNQVGETDIVPATSHDTTDEIVVVDGTQYATYMLEFTIDYDIDVGDVIIPHDDLAGRLRRVASTGDEVDGEVIVLDWHTHYTVDKTFKAPD